MPSHSCSWGLAGRGIRSAPTRRDISEPPLGRRSASVKALTVVCVATYLGRAVDLPILLAPPSPVPVHAHVPSKLLGRIGDWLARLELGIGQVRTPLRRAHR